MAKNTFIGDSASAERTALGLGTSSTSNLESSASNILPTAAIASSGVSANVARADHIHQDVVLQTAFGHVTADQTTTSATFVDLTGATVTITTIAGSKVWLSASFATSNTGLLGSNNFIRLAIDGVAFDGVGQTGSGAGAIQGSAICRLITGLSAGSHTFKLQWRRSAGTAQCRPVAAPDQEHANINVMEVRL